MLSKAYELVAQIGKQPLGVEPSYYFCTNLLIQRRGNELLMGITQPLHCMQGFNNIFIGSSASHGTPDDAVNLNFSSDQLARREKTSGVLATKVRFG